MIGQTTFQATARLTEDGVTMQVIATTPYGSRSVSVSEAVTDEKLLTKAAAVFKEAVKTLNEDLERRAINEAARCIVTANDKGEAV